MVHSKQSLLLAFLSLAICDPARAGDLPKRVGECVKTTIKSIETRLVDGSTNKPIPGSGSAVNFENGGYQVSYDTVPAIEHSKAGDPVRMCLVSTQAIAQRATIAAECTARPICARTKAGP